ncbi:MAG TPA: hypothetical protein VES69_13875 [Pyrinomonadaceae bacterium]|nr:hypothetical protein [Pyrinomonadaceae bacterium]
MRADYAAAYREVKRLIDAEGESAAWRRVVPASVVLRLQQGRPFWLNAGSSNIAFAMGLADDEKVLPVFRRDPSYGSTP